MRLRRIAGSMLVVGALVLTACSAAPGADSSTGTASASPSVDAAVTAGNARTVQDFYRLAFVEGRVAEAAHKYIGDPYVQHNPLVGNGAQAFVDGIGGIFKANPQRTAIVHRVIAQGDLVLVHSEHHNKPGDAGSAVMDIFRLQGGKIVEHWDAIQPVETKTASGHTMFNGPRDAGAAGEEQLQRNTKTVLDFADLAFNQAKAQEAVDKYVGAEYTQHNPFVADGGTAFVKAFAGAEPTRGADATVFPRTIAQGDLVGVQMFTPGKAGAGSGSIDIFRLEDGKIVEHWDAVQDYPATTKSGNTVWDSGR